LELLRRYCIDSVRKPKLDVAAEQAGKHDGKEKE
jgi:hypothetical protein